MTTTAQPKDLDIVIFGATGYTGKLIVEEFCRNAQIHKERKITWAIAGRSEVKLLEVVNIVNITTSNTVGQPAILIADVNDYGSLKAMTRRAKVVIDCVGPYRFLGEPVVRACLEERANYVDIAGETEYIERMQVTYHDTAKENNVTIVPACGFDSVPSDFGFLYTKQQLESRGVLPSSIEFFCRWYAGSSGIGAHFTTFESLIHSLANINSLRQLRAQSTKPRVPKIGPPLKKIPYGRWEKRVNGYVVPFIFADPSVIRLSQQLDIENNTGVPPVQFAGYAVIPKIKYLIQMIIGYKLISLLSHFRWGRWLLLKFPRIFTFGTFSYEGPNLEQMQHASFTTTFYGRGFSKELLDTILETNETTPLTQDRHSLAALEKVKPDVEIVTQVSGPEPIYTATSIIAVQCAYMLLTEPQVIPPGVLTTSVAFNKTRILQRLVDNGIGFRVVEGRFDVAS